MCLSVCVCVQQAAQTREMFVNTWHKQGHEFDYKSKLNDSLKSKIICGASSEADKGKCPLTNFIYSNLNKCDFIQF